MIYKIARLDIFHHEKPEFKLELIQLLIKNQNYEKLCKKYLKLSINDINNNVLNDKKNIEKN